MKFLAAIPLFTLAAAAEAAPPATAEAEVEWRHEARDKVVVDESLWKCAATVCRGEVIDQPKRRLRACLKLASQTGRVLAFRTPAAALDESELARCNRGR